MGKYRTVEFQGGQYGVQKRNIFGFWNTQGYEDCDPMGFSYAWQPHTFASRKLAKRWIKAHGRDPYKIINQHP